MLLVRYDCSQDQVLLISLLNRIEADLAIQHPKVRSIVLGQRVVPVFEVRASPSWTIIPGMACFLLCKLVPIELILWPETSVELVFKIVHELSVPRTLVVVVL